MGNLKQAVEKEEWAIMPCYNEEQHIFKAIEDVHKNAVNVNLVVVDDGSKDKTFEIAQTKNKYVLKHAINLGKGAALKTGIEFVLKKGAKKIVFIDSDGQHEAAEIPKFMKLLDKYDIVFGSRRLNKKMPVIFRLGNYLLSNIIYLLFGVKLRDTQSGYRGITSKTYKIIKWEARDYSVESEIIAKVGKNKLKYTEIGIRTIYHSRYKGTTVMDGIKIMIKMLLYKLKG